MPEGPKGPQKENGSPQGSQSCSPSPEVRPSLTQGAQGCSPVNPSPCVPPVHWFWIQRNDALRQRNGFWKLHDEEGHDVRSFKEPDDAPDERNGFWT